MSEIAIADVVVGKRLREAKDLDSLIESIQEVGLLTPITVTTGMELVAGLHRLEACKRLGWARIPANVVDLSEIDRELGEIDENLIRNEGTALERSQWLKRRKQLYEAKYPQAGHGCAPGKPGGGKSQIPKDDKVSSFAQDTAKKTGHSPRTVQRDLQVDLDEKTVETIQATPVADNRSALLGLSKLKDETVRHQAAEMLVNGEAKNVQQAQRRIAERARVARAKAVTAPKEEETIRFIHGDAVCEIMHLEAKPHCVVTDPPYGLETHRTRNGGKDYSDGEEYALDLLDRTAEALRAKLADDAHLYVFSGYSYVHAFKEILSEYFEVQDNPIVWVKENHTMCDFAKWYPNKHEYVIFAKMKGSKRPLAACVPDVLTVPRQNDTTHSAEKPVELLKKLISQSTEGGELVLDPFMGAGSSAVAAKELSRAFVGIEVDNNWIDVARSRVFVP
jgi:hypothetical protein